MHLKSQTVLRIVIFVTSRQPNAATGSILRRINLAEFATSLEIKALTQDVVRMRRTSLGSEAIVSLQFVNMHG